MCVNYSMKYLKTEMSLSYDFCGLACDHIWQNMAYLYALIIIIIETYLWNFHYPLFNMIYSIWFYDYITKLLYPRSWKWCVPAHRIMLRIAIHLQKNLMMTILHQVTVMGQHLEWKMYHHCKLSYFMLFRYVYTIEYYFIL